jgi:hypothetical protein
VRDPITPDPRAGQPPRKPFPVKIGSVAHGDDYTGEVRLGFHPIPIHYRLLRRRLRDAANARSASLDDVTDIIAKTAWALRGGRRALIEYLHLAMLNGDDTARAWWEVYESLGRGIRELASLDQITAAAGIAVADLLRVVEGMTFAVRTGLGRIIANDRFPETILASVRRAAHPSGVADRRLLMQAAGFLPLPKGSTINIQTSASAGAFAAASQSVVDPSVPRFLDDVDAAASPRASVQQAIILEGDAGHVPAGVAPDPDDEGV